MTVGHMMERGRLILYIAVVWDFKPLVLNFTVAPLLPNMMVIN